MSQSEMKRVWLAAVLVVLASTYPSWIHGCGNPSSSYDAPWIYPSMNPVVQSEIHAANFDTSGKISLAR